MKTIKITYIKTGSCVHYPFSEANLRAMTGLDPTKFIVEITERVSFDTYDNPLSRSWEHYFESLLFLDHNFPAHK